MPSVNNLRFGSSVVSAVYFGSTPIRAMYVGSTSVWVGQESDSSSSALPYKRELAYLEGTGMQWIDTGLIPLVGDEITVTFSYFGVSPSGDASDVYGVFNRTNSPYLCRWVCVYTGSLRVAFFGESNLGSYDNFPKPTTITSTNLYYKVNDTVYSNPTPYPDPAPEYSNLTILLFARNRSDSGIVPSRSGMRIYKFSITGRIDLVPVMDYNDVPCMYDKVSGQFFYNQGTGTFLYGELTD